ncbi:MAG: hypothetical protein NTV22_08415 [bacterium]|nr:hypothetical protein [bacterium]
MKTLATLIVTISLIIAALPLLAADRTWIGTTDGNWATPGNWDGGVTIPADGDNISFPDVANQTITLGADRIIGTLTINAPDAYVINTGNRITLGGALTQSGAGTVTLNNTLTLVASQSLAGTGAGEVTLAGALTGSTTINVSGANWTLNADNSATLTSGTKWNVTGGRLSLWSATTSRSTAAHSGPPLPSAAWAIAR